MRNRRQYTNPSNLLVVGVVALSFANSFIGTTEAASPPAAFLTSHTPSSALSPSVGRRLVNQNHQHPSIERRNLVHQRRLFVDGGDSANGGMSNINIKNKKYNEAGANSKGNTIDDWGIPDSKTLKPLGPIDDKGKTIPSECLENGGRVTLIGSGPGDPDLLTMKAFKLLQDPSAMVICDRLVSEEIRDVVKGEIKVARKLPGCAEAAQQEIYHWTHQGLQAGKHVIRLKIGDPFVFGRGGEEVLTFRRFGVEPKVVPVSFVVDGRHDWILFSSPSHDSTHCGLSHSFRFISQCHIFCN